MNREKVTGAKLPPRWPLKNKSGEWRAIFIKIKRLQNGLRFLQAFFGVLVWPYDQSMDAGSSWFRLVFHLQGSSYQQLLDRNESRNDPKIFTGNPKIVINQTGLEKYWLN